MIALSIYRALGLVGVCFLFVVGDNVGHWVWLQLSLALLDIFGGEAPLGGSTGWETWGTLILGVGSLVAWLWATAQTTEELDG